MPKTKLLKYFIPIFLSLVMVSCSTKRKPKLILQITVDQLRGDMIKKYKSNFHDDGFLYLLNNGTSFTNAHYIHAITKTAPGHATLATGSTPSKHGIINNNWYSRKTHHLVYSCQDSASKILDNLSSEIGRSPKNLIAETFSDKVHKQNPKSKIFGISTKDRGAIMLAGHFGKAFWYSKKTGGITTSQYYYNKYPKWVSDWNKNKLFNRYYKNGWNLIYNKDRYQNYDVDSNNYERTLPGLGHKFPHSFKNLSLPNFYKLLPYSPWGDRLTFEFAKSLIETQKLGIDENVDYLSISFSSTDYIGHLFGPNSLEYEDQIYNLDKTLSDLFKFIDKKIGLQNVLIVLSADHGVSESPEYLIQNGKKSGVVSAVDIRKRINEFGKKNLKLKNDLVEALIPPYIYLNESLIKKSNLSIKYVENALLPVAEKSPGVYKAFAANKILEDNFGSSDSIEAMVKNSYFAGRSGNLYIVNKPHWFFSYNPKTRENTATHGSPWAYDRFVPIIFAGHGIAHQTITKLVGPQDIAPTLSKLIGIPAPSQSVGKPLFK